MECRPDGETSARKSYRATGISILCGVMDEGAESRDNYENVSSQVLGNGGDALYEEFGPEDLPRALAWLMQPL